MSRAKKGLLLVAGLCVLASVAVVGLTIYFWDFLDFWFNDPFNDRRFDQTIWIENADSMEPDNPRGRMVTDLRRRLLKNHPTEAEVVELLGEPDVDRSAGFLSYNIGMWSGFRIDYDTLDVHFGKDGRVEEVKVIQH